MAKKDLQISEIFNNTDFKFGLRGDPHLWNAIKQKFDGEPWPATVELFHEQLHTTYSQLVGQPINIEDIAVIEEFDHGGMSSGKISPQFWREKGIPTLLERYLAACKN